MNQFKYAFFVLMLGIYACESHVQEDEFMEPKEEQACDPAISFSTTIKPIIDAKCVTCHGGNQAPNLSTFSGVSRNAQKVRAEIEARRMPLGGSLSTEQIQQIGCWIDNGMLNN